MKLIATLLLITFAIHLVAAYDAVPECTKYDCPSYTLLERNATSSVEIRQYESARWVRTKVMDFYYEPAVSTGFNRLFDYITGHNVDNTIIDMTAPVAVQVIPGAGPFCQSTFIVSFFVPTLYQSPNAAPPAPTNPDVFVETLPETIKAVYMFPGYVHSWSDLIEPITELTTYCDANNYNYVENIETIAGYDSPFTLSDRHNEIWIDIWGSY